MLFYKRHGELHRKDGPARMWAYAEYQWWQYNLPHRESHPAIIDKASGEIEYWIRGVYVET